ncbi:hypothetical protein M6B22_21910 [Jatrophihabitans cynanchi]|uniref:DUF317 domain-containing protein n=1 Tax=Jatrophihabitans cynanchi TaxID=2944128 RepID=A0ABY7JX43_9ACTN|nr:hypothetical protein [Jatrophihabitans sp. SB3-54]WAX57145.1 hypothetical protein M6B22_21910 [Jatrophihabitans sp. SB3-54]
MNAPGVVAEALARLADSNLLTAVLGVRSEERNGVETAVVTVRSDTAALTRDLIARALAGLPCERVDNERPARGFARGLTGVKDNRTWRIGTQSDVAWIADGTAGGLKITSAIPPVFDAYATVSIPADAAQREAAESVLVQLLAEQSAGQSWSLGYLDTGAHDVVFDHAPAVTLYTGWNYILVEAGPMQAKTWRADDPWRGRLPDLMYPADRSWLVSMLWDDDWRCLGGPASLLDAVLAEPILAARAVGVDQDATPPGHTAR